MASNKPLPAGYLTFTLHAHLPFVVNHGTWPHGIEWLHEAAAETYLPLLRMFGRLQRDGLALRCNLNLSPILLEQLAHPVFKEDFPRYLERKITSAREDEAFFLSTGQNHYAELARFWGGFFAENLSQFESIQRDIISSFRFFNDIGHVDIITCAATHGYLPLLGTDESVRAQIRAAISSHIKHIGQHPRGIWIPECGYRPAGPWNFPVSSEDKTSLKSFTRIGIEQALAESGLEYFFVDTHLIESSAAIDSPYSRSASRPSLPGNYSSRALYRPYFVAGASAGQRPMIVFPRDPRTGLQVWSGESGYPGDPAYLDFHKKRWPGGHRYWCVTGPQIDMAYKAAYDPSAAADRIRTHAEHFVHLVRSALPPAQQGQAPAILCAPFDAELFGHWWFEGPLWLEAVARALHNPERGNIELTTCAHYLDTHPPAASIAMPEGSWGAGGTNHVWMNADTSWTYKNLYPAELFVRELCTSSDWRDSGPGERIAKQLCRELLLLESSDWQFLITTGAARDYAESRFSTHLDHFQQLRNLWNTFAAERTLTPEADQQLAAIEQRDSIFPDIDPAFWAAGAHDTRAVPATQYDEEAMKPLSTEPNLSAGDGPRMELPKFNAGA